MGRDTATAKANYCCKSSPLFDFIPIDHVIVDTLHSWRVLTLVLMELVIRELKSQDAVDIMPKPFPVFFASLDSGFCKIFSEIVAIRVNKLKRFKYGIIVMQITPKRPHFQLTCTAPPYNTEPFSLKVWIGDVAWLNIL